MAAEILRFGWLEPNTFFNECLAAHLVGYGTNHVPNPPYIDSVTA